MICIVFISHFCAALIVAKFAKKCEIAYRHDFLLFWIHYDVILVKTAKGRFRACSLLTQHVCQKWAQI